MQRFLTIARHIGSLKTTLLALVLLAVAVILILMESVSPTVALAPAMTLLITNLATAIFVTDKIRSNTALLVFHLALLAIMLLVLASRLTYLKGWVELAEGETFAKLSGILSQGPLHPGHFDKLRFTQEQFEVEFIGNSRGNTFSRVTWHDGNGQVRAFTIKEQQPFTLANYQFTVSNHIGFAPIFTWQSSQQMAQGAVHLPSYLYNRDTQTLEWRLPGTDIDIWATLEFDDEVIGDTFMLPTEHSIVLQLGSDKYPMKPGDSHRFEQGTLNYLELRRWIGYEVFYDWSIPWLLASCITAILSLALFLCQKWHRQPWYKIEDQSAQLTESRNG